MDGTRVTWILTLVCGLSTLAMAGCTEFDDLASAMPWQGATTELPGVPSPAERIASLREMANTADSQEPLQQYQTAQQLVEAIRIEEDPAIRAEIIRTLAAYDVDVADKVLRLAVEDPEKVVRVAACEVWGERGGPDGAHLLATTLDYDTDIDVRLAAARALGQLNEPEALAALTRALDDRDPAIQYRSVLSLENATGKDFGRNVHQWQQYAASGMLESEQIPSMAQRFRDVLPF